MRFVTKQIRESHFPWCEWCVCKVPACNTVINTNTIATSCIENVSAQSEKCIDTSQYKELPLPKISESLKQVAVLFIRELDEYFILRKAPEEFRLPLVFRSISDPFAKRWMLTAYGQLKSYDDFKKTFSELLWDGTRRSEIRCQVYQDGYTYRSGESLSEHYIRYANLASMLSPAMSDQDLLGTTITITSRGSKTDKCHPKVDSRSTCFPH
jgi:hypothetical protein